MDFIVSFNIFGFVHCGENLILVLNKHDFIYEFNYEIKEPTSHPNLIDFSVEE